MSAAEIPPKWVLMEPFISRRDSDEPFPFPDESSAPVRASGTTSWNASFTIAFKLAEPPAISRMYAYLPGFPGGSGSGRQVVSLLSTHQHLALFRVGRNSSRGEPAVQDLFVFNGSNLSLKQLPHCTLSELGEHARCDGRPSRSTPTSPEQRMMSIATTGLLCQDNESVVADATVVIKGRKNNEVYADLYWLRSSSVDYSDCQWNCARTRVLSSESTHEFRWQSYTVIPFLSWLCWIDYNRGIIFGDMFKPTPTLRFVRLPPEEESGSGCSPNLPKNPHCWMYRDICAIDARSCLKFVKIVRHDSKLCGPLTKGCGFTITCHTLLLKEEDSLLNEKVWEKEFLVTSEELWSANPDLPHDILTFPQVDMGRPHVIHFLTIENTTQPWKKMWIVSVNMSTKKMESIYPYVNGMEAARTEDADLTKEKSLGPLSFVPCCFSEFLQRKRKNVEKAGRGSTNLY